MGAAAAAKPIRAGTEAPALREPRGAGDGGPGSGVSEWSCDIHTHAHAPASLQNIFKRHMGTVGSLSNFSRQGYGYENHSSQLLLSLLALLSLRLLLLLLLLLVLLRLLLVSARPSPASAPCSGRAASSLRRRSTFRRGPHSQTPPPVIVYNNQ